MGQSGRTTTEGWPEERSKAAPALPLAHLVSELQSTPRYSTVVEMFVRAAEEDGDLLFTNSLNGSRPAVPLTFRGAFDEARRVAAILQSRRLGAQGKVLSLLPTGPGALATFFGTLLAGGVSVPGNPPMIARGEDPSKAIAALNRLARDADAEFLVVSEKDAENIAPILDDDNDLKGLILDGSWSDASPADAIPVELKPDDIALIQYTSGPVTVPRGVVLSHRAVMANVKATSLVLDSSRDDVALSWLPLSQDFGLIGAVLSSLYRRFPMHLMRPEAFLLRPHTWLQEMSRLGVTITAAPNFAYEMCLRRIRDRHMKDLDLSALRVALTGAETVDPKTVAAFEEKFAGVGFARGAFLPAYGLAENGLTVSAPKASTPLDVECLDADELNRGGWAIPASTASENIVETVSLGPPAAGEEVAIVNSDGRMVVERRVGEIVIRSPSVMDGYYKNDGETNEILRKGWLHTGDLGFIADGRLFITGRLKDMVIKRGRNYYPCDVEAAADRVEGIDAGAVVSFAVYNPTEATESLVILAESPEENEEALKSLEKALSNQILGLLAIRPDQLVLAPSGSLPRDGEGTILRAACRERYLSNPEGFGDDLSRSRKSPKGAAA